MSKKDYWMIANVFKKLRTEMDENMQDTFYIDTLAKKLASEFKDDNIHFNREKFLEACGIA